MKVGIIQARMGSSRLPGKVLMEAAGKPLLEHLLERVRRTKKLDQLILATSKLSQDDPIVEFCSSFGQPCFRGSEDDVLDRYYQAAKKNHASVVIRITADCPLIDPAIIDHAIEIYENHAGEFDLVTNRHPLTFPDGMDVDVIPIASLEKAWKTAISKPQREHVIPYFWEAGLRVKNFEDPGNGFRTHRWTLDYVEDYTLIRKIIEGLYPQKPMFTLQDILHYLNDKPELVALNSKYIP